MRCSCSTTITFRSRAGLRPTRMSRGAGNRRSAKRSRRLKKRGARPDRIATIGPVGAEQHGALTAAFGKITSLNKAYVRLRMIKSAEELDWLRIGAHLSDLGMVALRDGLKARALPNASSAIWSSAPT